jgi:subtilisin family serine protease
VPQPAGLRFYRLAELPGLPYREGDVLVRFRSGASAPAVEQTADAAGLRAFAVVVEDDEADGGSGPLLRVSTPLPVVDAVRSLQRDTSVEMAQPNYLYHAMDTPNDPRFVNGSLWGMYGGGSTPANAFGSEAAEVWSTGVVGSSEMVVAVLDTGIQTSHPDLEANIWTNPNEIPGNGVDDDHNGFVDDIHGWDFANNDASVFDGGASDPTVDAHGTHVAGTIGALGNNSLGVVGVNWNVKIVPAKFLVPDPFWGAVGDTADAVKALKYLVSLKVEEGVNLVAINASWAGSDEDLALREAIIRAAKADILFIAAAGNECSDNDGWPIYPANIDTTIGTVGESPASFDAVVAVVALDSDGELSWFSNVGQQSTDLGAPGAGIWSTVPVSAYEDLDGTSMAAPHVTGGVALLASSRPQLRAAELRAALLDGVRPTRSLTGLTATGGRLSLKRAFDRLGSPETLPPPVDVVAAIEGSNSIRVSWRYDA